MCVCEREREVERQTQRQGHREIDRGKMCVCVRERMREMKRRGSVDRQQLH